METFSSFDGNRHGRVVKIQKFSLQDGPGIRTTVFLKGCYLKCLWCSNPETQNPGPELEFENARCETRCDRCLKACPQGALEKMRDAVEIDRKKCTGCGICAQACQRRAFTLIGRNMSIDEVVTEVDKDRPFYARSGGGVTLSGGEPLVQYPFALGILKACQSRGISTALDTTGFTEWEALQEVLEYTDIVLYDLKHIDGPEHQRLTGVDNRKVLSNVQRLSQQGTPLFLRVPIIPGFNDDGGTLKKLAELVTGLPGIQRVDLLPYHRLGAYKYQRLGREYPLKDLKPASKAYMEGIRNALQSLGVQSSILA